MGFFQGKKAVVTGAGSGIGRALALKLAEAGCDLAVTDIREERLPGVVEELGKRGARAQGYRVDHSNWEQVRDFARAYREEWGAAPDILCCNAGVGLGARFLETSLEDWEWVLGVNLWGVIYTLHAFVPGMAERGSGSILVTASDAGLVAIPGMAAYQTSKFGVVGLAETLRMELHEHNIKVSILCPGFINTNIIKDGRIYLYDSRGKSSREEVERFYATRGVDPSVVAEAGLRALEKDRGIVLVPWFHSGPQYVLKRLSPGLYFKLFRFLWKKGIIHRFFGARP
jgi:NAD(P)-dependent dehydrogenase (short-subunit alcohol dehydrogenase family)